MYPGEVIVDVWNCRAAVARYVAVVGGGISSQLADNWEDLEPTAVDAIEDFGGAVNVSGHYPCPADLAALAVWS